jgi:SAM-dependent methyltransferase
MAAPRHRAASTASVWPLPALAAWAFAWGVFALLKSAAVPMGIAIAAAVLAGVALGVIGSTPWRRVFVAAGFPLSLLVSGAAGALPAWGWLLPLALLALVYPLNAWRDAPVFPTPAGALEGLAAQAPLAAGAQVLDAGCGLGAGLRELQRVYPQAVLHGLEWSWPLRLVCAWRCRFARVRRGDMWLADWSPYDIVYVFQRPESMARALEKAERDMHRGGWLVSLEFSAPNPVPSAMLEGANGRRVWLYRIAPASARAISIARDAR